MSNIRIRVKDVENFFLEYPSIEVKRKKRNSIIVRVKSNYTFWAFHHLYDINVGISATASFIAYNVD